MKVYDTPVTAVTGGSVGLNRRVSLSSTGTLVHAGPGEAGLGTFTWDTYASAGLASAGLAASGSRGTVHSFSTGGVFRMVASGAISVGAVVYADAAGKVSATGFFPLGVARTAALADNSHFEVWVPARADCPLYQNTAVSTNITNTTSATNFSLTAALPAATLRNGDHIEIEYAGLVSSVTATPTLAVRLLIGSAPLVLGSVAAATVANNGILVGRFSGVVRANAGTSSLNGFFSGFTGAAGAGQPAMGVANVTLDPAAANTVAVEATWNAASASNVVRLDMLRVNLRRQ